MRAGFFAVAAFGVVALAGCGGGSSKSSGTAPILPPTSKPGGPYTGTAYQAVSFNGSASSDPQGQSLTYSWNFGDGGTGTGANPTHTYTQVPGVTSQTYTVSLTVQNTSGVSGQASTTAVIQDIAALSDGSLTGVVMTGQNPIIGAHVYLFAANTTGYAGPGIAASSSNASVSLLSAQETATSDAVGAYVLTNSSGAFTMTGDYTCTSGQQLYVYALGGNTGSGANASAGLLAAIGSCPSSSGPATVAWVNEVSTVAAAYAMAGFATDATHVSSSSTALAQAGMANAFANAANLEKLSTGAALATTPAGNGTVPQTEINSLANILSTCVNPANSVSNACSILFAAALSGGLTGTAATDTATAAIYIAHNPAANPSDLFAVAITTPPYTPALSRQPNDFTIGITYAGGGLNAAQGIAIDGSGAAWVANSGNNSVSKFSSLGAVLSGAGGFTVGGLNGPHGISIDGSGNAWVVNTTGNSVTALSSAGAALTGSPYSGGLNKPSAIAIDGSGNAWVANQTGNSVIVFSGTGSVLNAGGYTGGGLNQPDGIALDGSGNAWMANAAGNSVTELSSTGTVRSGANGYAVGSLAAPGMVAIDGGGSAWVANASKNTVLEISSTGGLTSGSNGFSGGGLATPEGIAIDGAGNAWVVDEGGNGVTEFSNAGALLSGTNGYSASGLNAPTAIAIDGSGDAWVINSGSNSVTEFVGAGVPVVTPLAVGVKNNTLGAKP